MPLNLEPEDLSLLIEGSLHRSRAGFRMGPAGIAFTSALAKQSAHALKGQCELQDPPAAWRGPQGPLPEAEAALGVLRRTAPPGPDGALRPKASLPSPVLLGARPAALTSAGFPAGRSPPAARPVSPPLLAPGLCRCTATRSASRKRGAARESYARAAPPRRAGRWVWPRRGGASRAGESPNLASG